MKSSRLLFPMLLACAAAYGDVSVDPQGSYERAVSLVGKRDSKLYAEAARLLKGAVEHAETKNLKQDAAAYQEWIAVEIQVRLAERAWRAGRTTRAHTLLKAAEGAKILGYEAKQSIRDRRARWEREGTPPAAKAGPQVKEVSGRRVDRGQTVEFAPGAFIHFMNPTAHDRTKLIGLLTAPRSRNSPGNRR